MNLPRAIREYLLSSGRLTGHAAKPFSSPQTVGRWTLVDRNDAREALRSMIGQQIYLDRLPHDAGNLAIIVRTIDVQRDYALTGDSEARLDLIELAVHARGENSANVSQTAADLLGLCVSGFHDGTWGDLSISECLIDGESTRSFAKGDGTDRYSFERSLDLRIYSAPVSALYPALSLAAFFQYKMAAGTGTEVRVQDASTIPEGRTLDTIQWDVRQSSGATVLVTVSGAPDVAVSHADVSGTYREPAFDRTAIGIPDDVHITETVTDSYGDTSVYAEAQTT